MDCYLDGEVDCDLVGGGDGDGFEALWDAGGEGDGGMDGICHG